MISEVQIMLRDLEISRETRRDPGPLFSVMTFLEARLSGMWEDISFLSRSCVTALVVGALCCSAFPADSLPSPSGVRDSSPRTLVQVLLCLSGPWLRLIPIACFVPGLCPLWGT